MIVQAYISVTLKASDEGTVYKCVVDLPNGTVPVQHKKSPLLSVCTHPILIYFFFTFIYFFIVLSNLFIYFSAGSSSSHHLSQTFLLHLLLCLLLH